MRLPPLCVGMGIYLPMALTLLIPIGAVLGHFYDRAVRTTAIQNHPEDGRARSNGPDRGESLFGVAFAGCLPLREATRQLAVVGDSFRTPGIAIGLALFIGAVAILYRAARKAVEER